MKNTKKIGLGTGKVILALLGGILAPVLIWVALGVVLTRNTGRLHRALVPATG